MRESIRLMEKHNNQLSDPSLTPSLALRGAQDDKVYTWFLWLCLVPLFTVSSFVCDWFLWLRLVPLVGFVHQPFFLQQSCHPEHPEARAEG